MRDALIITEWMRLLLSRREKMGWMKLPVRCSVPEWKFSFLKRSDAFFPPPLYSV